MEIQKFEAGNNAPVPPVTFTTTGSEELLTVPVVTVVALLDTDLKEVAVAM